MNAYEKVEIEVNGETLTGWVKRGPETSVKKMYASFVVRAFGTDMCEMHATRRLFDDCATTPTTVVEMRPCLANTLYTYHPPTLNTIECKDAAVLAIFDRLFEKFEEQEREKKRVERIELLTRFVKGISELNKQQLLVTFTNGRQVTFTMIFEK